MSNEPPQRPVDRVMHDRAVAAVERYIQRKSANPGAVTRVQAVPERTRWDGSYLVLENAAGGLVARLRDGLFVARCPAVDDE